MATANALQKLAKLGEIADEAISIEEKEPTLPATVRANAIQSATLRIAGFAVIDNDALNQSIESSKETRRQTLARYRSDRDKIREQLSSFGIPVLTVVPAKAFRRLCDESGLVTLSPHTSDENVIYPQRLIREFKEKTFDISSTILGLASASVGILTLVYTCIEAGDLLTLGHFSKLLVGSAIVSVIASMIFGIPQKSMRDLLTRYLINNFCKRPMKEILSELQKVDTGSRGRKISFNLPKPPEDVAVTLLRANSYNLPLWVAADPSALSFDVPIEALLQDEMNRQEERRKMMPLLEHDPIVYVIQGEAAAIIAQFGDFAIEEEVMQKVMHSEFLI